LIDLAVNVVTCPSALRVYKANARAYASSSVAQL